MQSIRLSLKMARWTMIVKTLVMSYIRSKFLTTQCRFLAYSGPIASNANSVIANIKTIVTLVLMKRKVNLNTSQLCSKIAISYQLPIGVTSQKQISRYQKTPPSSSKIRLEASRRAMLMVFQSMTVLAKTQQRRPSLATTHGIVANARIT